MNRTHLSALFCGFLLAACKQEHDPYAPKTPEQRAKEERADAEERYRNHRAAGRHLAAAQTLVDERLVDDDRDRREVQRHLATHAGAIEGATPADRCGGYTVLARLAKRAGLDPEVGQRYATSALHACVATDDLNAVMHGALLAKEFSAEPDLQWRAAARVWALRVKEPVWPNPEVAGAPAFVAEFPLSGSLASAAYAAATERGDWKATRMIAERAQLPDDQFRAARTKEVEELVGDAIRRRDDQRLLQLNLEAPGFVNEAVVKTVAARVVEKLLGEGQPGEAYALALAHGLDAEHAKRAADAFFAAAIKNRTFSLARPMPDGTFIIVERPPPAPVSVSPNPPSGYAGGH